MRARRQASVVTARVARPHTAGHHPTHPVVTARVARPHTAGHHPTHPAAMGARNAGRREQAGGIA